MCSPCRWPVSPRGRPKHWRKRTRTIPARARAKSGNTNKTSSTPAKATNGTLSATATNTTGTNNAVSDKKSKEDKAIEVVFVADGDHVKMVPVKIASVTTITGKSRRPGRRAEVVSGGYRAISKDLEDGKKIKRGTPDKGDVKEAK